MTHICVSNLTIIGSDNGLSPGRREAIIWTNAGISSIGSLETNCSVIFIEILTFSFKNMRLKVSPGKWGPLCLGSNGFKGPSPCYHLPFQRIHITLSAQTAMLMDALLDNGDHVWTKGPQLIPSTIWKIPASHCSGYHLQWLVELGREPNWIWNSLSVPNPR